MCAMSKFILEVVGNEEEEEMKRRREFRPCLSVLHLPVRNNITILALTIGSAVRPVPLPEDIASRSWKDQLMIVRTEIEKHQARWARWPGMELLGGIRGYWYEQTFDNAIFLSPQGQVRDCPAGLVTGHFSVRVGKKSLDAPAAQRLFGVTDDVEE